MEEFRAHSCCGSGGSFAVLTNGPRLRGAFILDPADLVCLYLSPRLFLSRCSPTAYATQCTPRSGVPREILFSSTPSPRWTEAEAHCVWIVCSHPSFRQYLFPSYRLVFCSYSWFSVRSHARVVFVLFLNQSWDPRRRR